MATRGADSAGGRRTPARAEGARGRAVATVSRSATSSSGAPPGPRKARRSHAAAKKAVAAAFPPLDLNEVPGLFAGKSCFFTGVTGMLGKVLIEKMIRSTPDIRVVYCLIRARQGIGAQARLEEELFGSRIWERLLQAPRSQGGFAGDRAALRAHLRRRIVAVEGDLLSGMEAFTDGVIAGVQESCRRGPPPAGILGISPAWRERLAREGVDIVCHNAATVNFDEPIDLAVRMNTLAPLAMMHLAREWGAVAHVHVSTAYVIAHHPSGHRSPERLDKSPRGLDPDDIIKTVVEFGRSNRKLKNNDQLLERIAINAMGSFPNTYTLTKHMAEMKIIELNEELGLPLTIVRPSIIGASLREPTPGWIDTLSAAAAVFTAGGLGMLRILPGNPQGIGDIVPVDMVVNLMLLRVADLLNYRRRHVDSSNATASDPPTPPPVVFAHSATSTMNPVKWRTCETIGETFYFDNSLHQAGPVIGYNMINNPHRFNVEWWLRFTMPLYLYRTAAEAVGSTPHIAEAAKLAKSVQQGVRISNLFKAFTKNEFFYETDQVQRYVADATAQMVTAGTSAADPEKYRPAENPFNVDSREIIWNTYLRSFSYGIRRFILQEDMVPLPPQLVSHKNNVQLTSDNLISWDHDHHPISFPGLFPDATWAYTSGRAPGYTSRGVFGKLLGWTGWKESKLHEAAHISRSVARTQSDMMALVLASDAVRSAAARVDRRNAIEGSSAAGTSKNGRVPKAHMGIGLGATNGITGAEQIFLEMAADMNMKKARPASYFLRKAWRKLYDSINVDEDGLERVRRLLEGKAPSLPGGLNAPEQLQKIQPAIERQVVRAKVSKKKLKRKATKGKNSRGRGGSASRSNPGKADRPCVVLVPSHRSYVDFVILSYIFFAYNMPIPYIAAGDWIKKLGPLTQAMKHAGAFVIKRSFRPIPYDETRNGAISPENDTAVEAGENLYSAVYSSYIQQLVSDGQSVEFFLEGTRSRSGKSLPPKMGMLRSIIEPWLKGNAVNLTRMGSTAGNSDDNYDQFPSLFSRDIHFVPVTIDYERTLELSAMANELLGKEKTPESLTNLLQWVIQSVAGSLGQSASAFLSTLGLPLREMKTRMAGGSTFSSGRSRPLKGGKQGLPELNENGYFAKGYGPPLKMTTLGSLSLQFGEPISLASYAHSHMSKMAAQRLGSTVPRPVSAPICTSSDLDIATITSDLAYHIIDRLHARSVAHGTHIVAATLLMYRSAGSISFKDLETHVRFLAGEIEARGMIVDLAPRHPSQWSTAIRRALGLLQDSVKEVRTGVFAPNGETRLISSDSSAGGGAGGLGDGVDPRIHFIELAYLRNKIMHVFSKEAVWACALHACSKRQIAVGQEGLGGVPLHELLENVIFMDKLFAREFIRNRSHEVAEEYQMAVYRKMLESSTGDRTQIFASSRELFGSEESAMEEIVSVAPNQGETMYAFLCSLLWPFFDGYYGAALTLISLMPTARIMREDLVLKMQWVTEALYHDGKIRHYESCSLDTLRHALKTFEDMGVVGTVRKASAATTSNSNGVSDQVGDVPLYTSGVGQDARPGLVQLMPKFQDHDTLQDFVASIGRLRKTANPLMTGSDAATQSATMMAELPVLRKSRL